MKNLLIILLVSRAFIIKAQDITGFYTNKDLLKQSQIALNLYPDSSFNYFFLNVEGYGVEMTDRSGKYIFNGQELILNSIITKDTIEFDNSAKLITDKIFDYSEYFDLHSGIYSSKPEICIQFDNSIKKLFPDLRVFLDYDFKNEIVLNQYNNVVFEYPKNSVLRYINLRSSYFNINIDFDNYYRTIDKNSWRVSKNLLTINMKDKLMEFKQMDFKTFAKYFVGNNRLELKFACETDYSTMLNNPITLILNRIE